MSENDSTKHETEKPSNPIDDLASKAQEAGAHAAQQAASDIDATGEQWKSQLERDRDELVEGIKKQGEAIHDAAHAITHPEELVDAAKAGAEQAQERIKQGMESAQHPESVKKALDEKTAQVQDSLNDLGDKANAAFTGPIDKVKLPRSMRVYGWVCIVCAVVAIPVLGWMIWKAFEMFASGQMTDLGVSTIVVTFLHLGVLTFLAISFIVLGTRLLRNQRKFAALWCYVLYVLIIAGALCSLMLFGANWSLIAYLALFIATIAVQSYLDPHLRAERQKARDKKAHEDLEAAKQGTLGRDIKGKGYITLNFFNLFWVFVVCSIIGLFMEEIVHYLIVVPGQWQDRAGLLFGPFSPIYGCGAVLMTLALNRFHDKNLIFIFLVSAVIGGAFEYFVSFFMQYTYGAVAWNYTGQWLSIGGRTCGWAMGCWGLLGVIWIKLLLPFMLRIVNLIPWNWRYTLTVIAAVLMLADAVMSLMALDCWYERLDGDPVKTPIQRFYADNFDNEWMANRFQSMTIDPGSATRNGGKLA